MATTMNKFGLLTTCYYVSDIEAAKAWYSTVFDTAPYYEAPFYVGFNIAGFELGLMPQESTSEKTPSVISYWSVEDVAAEYARLLSLGATMVQEPHSVGDGVIIATVADLWGNIVGMIYNPKER